MTVRAAIGLVVIVLAAPGLAADETRGPLSMLTSGDRVRLRFAEGGDKLSATVESVTADELVLQSPDAARPLRLSLAQLQSLDVTRGRRSQWRKGAVIGFIPGALLIGGGGGTICGTYGDRTGCPFDWGFAVTFGLIGGAATASVGALVGLAFKTDRWVRLHERKPKLSLMLAPMKGGTRASLSVSF